MGNVVTFEGRNWMVSVPNVLKCRTHYVENMLCFRDCHGRHTNIPFLWVSTLHTSLGGAEEEWGLMFENDQNL